MLLDHYVSAMDSWKGRIDSETDYDAFRWHQWVQPIDLNDVKEVRAHMPFALVIAASAKAPIPTTLLAEADTCPLGYFDNNLHRHSNRHYTDDLRGRVLLIKGKQANNPSSQPNIKQTR